MSDAPFTITADDLKIMLGNGLSHEDRMRISKLSREHTEWLEVSFTIAIQTVEPTPMALAVAAGKVISAYIQDKPPEPIARDAVRKIWVDLLTSAVDFALANPTPPELLTAEDPAP